MTDEAAGLLAAALHERGELLGGANGALPGAAVLAERDRAAAGAGRWPSTSTPGCGRRRRSTSRPRPPGRLRRATEDDADLVLDWFTAFHVEADEQAGRDPDPDSGEHNTLESVLVRIREGVEWLWELPDGEVVHLSGAEPAVLRGRADRPGVHAEGAPRCAASRPTSWAS